MSIITISRGSSSMGKVVAEKVAERLGYCLISREILLDASSRFNVSEIKLEKAIHDAPGILERYRHSKQSYIAYIRSALMDRIMEDNVVYHGLAGHLLLKGISHVLKVRITADMEKRVANFMKKDQFSVDDARLRIQEDDKQRREWTQSLYGQDPWDSALYDLTICIERLSIDNAVDFICQAVAKKGFQVKEKDRQKAADMAVACQVKAALVDEFPNLGVTCEYGNVLIYVRAKDSMTAKLVKRLNRIRQDIDNIYHLETHAGVEIPPDAV
jgi:cytidylate kinase